MPRITLIRHGKAAAGWGDDADPGLDEVGRAQADALVESVPGPAPLFVSPLRRTRETAQPLADAWDVAPIIEPGVGEIVAPDEDLAARGEWLRTALSSTYAALGADYEAWRDRVLDTLRGLPDGAVVVTHFVAINAAVGAAWGDDRLVCFTPDNCARTVIDIDANGTLTVVDIGVSASTKIN